MEKDNFNREGQEETVVTRSVLGVGIAFLLVLMLVALVWFGLVNQPRSPQPATSVAVVATIRSSTTPTTLATVTAAANQTALATFTPSPETAAVTFNNTPSQLTPTVLQQPTSNLFPFFPTATPVVATSEYPYTTPVPNFDTATSTESVANTPTVDSFATAFANSFSTVFAVPTYTALATTTPEIVDSPTSAATPVATTETVTASWPITAAMAFDQLQTLHFVIDIRGGKVQIMPETDLKHAEGDLAHSSGDFQATIAAHLFVGDVTVKTVRVNNEQYLTSPIGGQWAKLSPAETFDLSVLFDQKNGIGALNRQLQNVSMLADATIDNVQCAHFSGTLPGSAVGPISYNTLGKNPVTLEEWVGKDDNLIRQIYLKETTPNGAFWVINLSKFNESLNIQKPNV